ncbi:MAG TPA: hypothetical protein ENI74_09755 [Gammaproteobacteria bacterium]|nr:hypothetical protein [Gammaproteobacteria bacterium]
MHKTRTTLNRLLDWLLVLALALAPMQGAFSAFGSTCGHDHRVTAGETAHHHVASIDPAYHDSKASPAQECCKHDSDDGDCNGVCNAFYASAYLLLASWNVACDDHQTYEPQLATAFTGRSVPTPLHPPL